MVNAPSRALRWALVILCLAAPAASQEHLNCNSWLQLSSADRMLSAHGGTAGALSAVQRIAGPTPNDDQKSALAALGNCLSDREPVIVDNLDSLCAREPSAGYPAFQAVIDSVTRQCIQNASAILAK